MTFRQVTLKVYLDVPEIQNFVTNVAIVGGMGDVTQKPRAVLYDAFDGDEFNLFTMNIDGTASAQVTED